MSSGKMLGKSANHGRWYLARGRDVRTRKQQTRAAEKREWQSRRKRGD